MLIVKLNNMAASKLRTSMVLSVLLVRKQLSSGSMSSRSVLIFCLAVHTLPCCSRLFHHHHSTSIYLEPIALPNGFGMDRLCVSTRQRCRGSCLWHSGGHLGAQTSIARRHYAAVQRLCHLRMVQHRGSANFRACSPGFGCWGYHCACQHLDQ